MWQKNLKATVVVTNLGHVNPEGRSQSIMRWVSNGGVLLVSDRTLAGMAKDNLQPDVLVLDEAHTMIRNSSTKIYKVLDSITTPRRIGKQCTAKHLLTFSAIILPHKRNPYMLQASLARHSRTM
jgi:hypothetical protein